MRGWRLLTLLLAIGLVSVAVPAFAQTDDSGTLTYDGAERSYHLHLPASYNDSEPTPLLIALHSFASSGTTMALMTGLDEAAEEQGFIVAYPNSLDYFWDDGKVNAGWPPEGEAIDDVGFLNAFIDQVTAEYAIDEAQIHLAGFGNGGLMAYRLACETPARFASLTAVSALLWEYHLDACPEDVTGTVPTLIILGTDDVYYPVDGLTTTLASDDDTRYNVLGVEDTLAFWLAQNGCDPETTVSLENSQVRLYDACDDGSTVAYLPVEGGGYGWPRVGDYTLNQVGIEITEVVASFVAGESDWAEGVVQAAPTVEVEGKNTPRSYHLYVPAIYDPEQPTPLVIQLHGRPDNGLGFAWRMDMKRVADEEGFIIVAPDGLDMEWKYYSGLSPSYPYNHIDDMAFLSTLVDDLALDLNIDRNRLYVVGFSNGGFFTQRLACERVDEFAAFASIGATMDFSFIKLCEDTAPAPILFMHGTEDPSIDWEGVYWATADGRYVQASLSVPDTVSWWAQHNGCSGAYDYTPLPISGESPGTAVTRFDFLDCDQPVTFYMIEGGGHNIPGVPNRIVANIARRVTLDIHAGEELWAFFSAHALDDGE